ASIVSLSNWVGAHPRISIHGHERYRHSARVRQGCDGANSVIDSESFRGLKNGLTSRKVYSSHGELEFIGASRFAAESALRIFCIAYDVRCLADCSDHCLTRRDDLYFE